MSKILIKVVVIIKLIDFADFQQRNQTFLINSIHASQMDWHAFNASKQNKTKNILDFCWKDADDVLLRTDSLVLCCFY